MYPSLFDKAGPNWMEHMLQAVHVKDGWNRMVDDVNQMASLKLGRSRKEGPKYKMNWAQNIVVMPQGTYVGPEYRYCPVGHKSSRHGKNTKGTFRVHDGYCQFCKQSRFYSWKSPTCRNVKGGVPRLNKWTYEFTVDGKKVDTPFVPIMVFKTTTNTAN